MKPNLSRGFIAAPLIGTLIFLSVILYVLHITQVEKSEVANIVSNTYHNSITSNLEQYRSDMGSLFAVSLSRAIEKYLSSGAAESDSKCTVPWNLFSLKNEANPSGSTSNTQGFYPTGVDGTKTTQDYGFNYDKIPFCYSTASVPQPIHAFVQNCRQRPVGLQGIALFKVRSGKHHNTLWNLRF